MRFEATADKFHERSHLGHVTWVQLNALRNLYFSFRAALHNENRGMGQYPSRNWAWWHRKISSPVLTHALPWSTIVWFYILAFFLPGLRCKASRRQIHGFAQQLSHPVCPKAIIRHVVSTIPQVAIISRLSGGFPLCDRARNVGSFLPYVSSRYIRKFHEYFEINSKLSTHNNFKLPNGCV